MTLSQIFLSPIKPLNDPAAQDKATLLSALVLLKAPIVICLLITMHLKILGDSINIEIMDLILGLVFLTDSVAYVMARRAHYRTSSWLIVIESIFSVSSICLLTPTSDVLAVAPTWYALAILTASLVMSVEATSFAVFLNTIALVVVAVLLPDSLRKYIYENIIYFLALSSLMLSGAYLRAKSEKRFKNEQAKLVQASKLTSLGEMASGIAHEVNTPLAVISLRTEQLIEQLDSGALDKESGLETLKIIQKTCLRISHIIRGLRSFSRDAGQDRMKYEDLGQILTDTLVLCQEKLKQGQVRFSLQPEPAKIPPMPVEARAVEIAQVLMNLIGNASDAANEQKEKWIEVVLSASKDHVEIRVTDSGPGIPRDVQMKMMEPFFTTKPIGKGTGLGLSISRGIALAHGGALEYDTKAKNTSFVLRLPRVQEKKT